ncbi:MAG: M14 family zinc carboxypeptidase [Balneolaceae bacterium]|nr:M14 family zinc carboxypeptidase [Balneolaceae bacterium]
MKFLAMITIEKSLTIPALLLTLLLALPGIGNAQQDYYFDEETSFDPDIPSPQEFLGYEIGSHFTRYDRIVAYLERLAELSDKATIEEIGRTYEYRPQVKLTITSPENHARMDQIRAQRGQVTDLSAPGPDPASEPAVVALDYGVHGDETSSAEASMLTAYYLVAEQGAETRRFLEETVVHIDPSLNPDGRDRAASWHNMYKSFPPVADPADREHEQAWPGGRTNHFWHDLNRDWFALTQRESRNRMDFYHQWYPHLQIDFHEMGTGSSYFLEPTKPVRTWNPVLPDYHYEVMNPLIAQYQTDALDGLGALYWTKEVYDNIAPIYGATYPDMWGGVGSTFEVGSSRGLVQESDGGKVTFRSTIRRHLATGIATVRAAVEEKQRLFEYQRGFFEGALEQAADQPVRAYVFGDSADRTLTSNFLELVLDHRLEVYELGQDVELDGRTFQSGSSYVIPTEQVGYRTLHDIFESNTSFPDSVFYDITAWSLVQGYGIPYGEMTSGNPSALQGERVTDVPSYSGQVHGGVSDYAYLMSWDDYNAPAALYQLQDRGVRTRAAFQPFTAATSGGDRSFGYGSIVIPVRGQELNPQALHDTLASVAESYGVDLHATGTGMTPGGVDLGSRNIEPLDKPEAAMIVGEGVSSYGAGEVQFMLNMHLGMGVTRLAKSELGGESLQRYNTLIMVDGYYGDLEQGTVEEIRRWVRDGGLLIADEGGAAWAIREGLAGEDLIMSYQDTTSGQPRYNYEESSDRYLANTVPGVILEADIDPTHPVAFGASDRRQLFMKDGGFMLRPSSNPYATVARYVEEPLVGGHVNEENLGRIAGTAAVVTGGTGSGDVVLFAQNPTFRSYWHTTKRLFLNALLFGRNM